MKLSEKDIETLHYHINGKHIPYIEVRDEVLDHYQTALEKEEERSMEEVLAVLDQTFTIGYCRQTAREYLQNLKAEYPLQFKKQLLALFALKNSWIPILLLTIVLTLTNYIPKTGALLHLLNLIMLSSFYIENWAISRFYPNNEKKHQYRLIDDKPIFAHSKADSPKGFALLHVISYVIVLAPLLLIYMMEGASENDTNFIFQPPYLYATIVGVWLFTLMMIVRFRTKTNLSKPKLN